MCLLPIKLCLHVSPKFVTNLQKIVGQKIHTAFYRLPIRSVDPHDFAVALVIIKIARYQDGQNLSQK